MMGKEVLSNQQKLRIAKLNWLGEHSKHWNVVACWHVPNAMRKHYKGYDEHWLSKELTRYLNKVDRYIFKASFTNRGVRLPRIITLEYAEGVGWHAHGLLDCAAGMNEDETITVLKSFWEKQTHRFSTAKFETHISYFSYDQGTYLPYCLKATNKQHEQAQGILDLRNCYLPN